MGDNEKQTQESEDVQSSTGEVVSSSDRTQERFYKLFHYNLHGLSEAIGVRMKFFHYVIENMNRKNVLSRTQSQMQKATGISRRQIGRILNDFEEKNILIKGRNNYFVNPDVVWVGREGLRSRALMNYQRLIEKKLSEELKDI